LEPGVCGRLGNSGKERKRNERNDEEPGKVCEEKKLEVNVEKAKMMVFNNNKRKRKREENEWKWKGSEFKYLGYTFNERATDKAHKREIVMIDEIEKRKEEEENDDV
jgi:hypothetical protein